MVFSHPCCSLLSCVCDAVFIALNVCFLWKEKNKICCLFFRQVRSIINPIEDEFTVGRFCDLTHHLNVTLLF